MKPFFYNCCSALSLIIFATGCAKNYTHYYPDTDTTGVAIFSNTGNNVMTCFIDGKSWRTRDRETGGIFGSVYTTELEIRRFKTNSSLDTLTIRWRGGAPGNTISEDILLTFPVSKNFQWSDVSAWQGKRIALDSTNGYVSMITDYFIAPSVAGKGSVYFNTFKIDSTGPFNITGRMSGLLEANFITIVPGAYNLTSGRFDDNISGLEIIN